MRVLITGGAGFIGSHLADACLARGDDVLVLDDLSTGQIRNIEVLKAHPAFKYRIGRVQDEELTAELVDQVDAVFHLAASVGVRRIVDNPADTIENNLRSSEIVFAAAARKGKRVLFTSSSEVYGLSTDLPFREDGHLVLGATTKGRWSYACAKAMDEFLAQAYCNQRSLPVAIVRLFNTIGPRQTGHYGMVVPTLVRRALAQQPLQVYGNGTQTRCFGFVRDVVGALLALMDHPDVMGEVVNVGSDSEISILDLARRIIAATGSPSKIELVPYAEAYEEGFEDMPRRVPDLSKIRRLIGYEPATTIDDIITSVIQSCLADVNFPTAVEAESLSVVG
jgi:UDP-glucose 4-epimerase